ncbi:MAG TPA: Clp protease N-terminal domain-containing protein [Verrucomicrobiae bacterium]|nr:Clp protease N-terminal domain-containing protein [Verrucomicrobiae bacterium]
MNAEKFQPQLVRVLAMAEIEAERDQSAIVGVEHVLIAMMQEADNAGAVLMRAHGLTVERLRQRDYAPKANSPAQ